MKKVIGAALAAISAVTIFAGLAGCSSTQSKPYAKKVDAIRTTGIAIKKAKNVETKVTKLAKVENQYQTYLDKKSKKQFPEVKKAYRDVIRSGKRQVKAIDAQVITKNTVGKLDKETVDSLNTKAAALTTLTATIKHHEKVVYTHKETTALVTKLTKQIANTRADVTQVILNTDSSKKYIDAYNQFTGKGIAVPGTERGDDTNADIMGFYESIGLTKNEYLKIYGGIWDYYGNARNKKWITEQQSSDAQSQAMDKLYSGKYATKTISIHKMNFYQIEQGNFESLVGSWKMIASGANYGMNKGFQWGPATEGYDLSISKTTLSDGDMTLHESSNELIVSHDGETGKMSIDNDGDFDSPYLSASGSTSGSLTQFYISFYPAGVPIDKSDSASDLKNVDSSKERIITSTSNNSFTGVYQRE